jgi:hypothetical protein
MRQSPEYRFFIYAFPALRNCAKISEDDYSRIESMLISKQAPTREELERLFPKAIERIRRYVKKKNIWRRKYIDGYWLGGEHNRIIDALEDGYENSLPELREECKVKIGIVKAIYQKDGRIELEYEARGAIKKAFSYITLKPKNYLSVHLGKVVEKLTKRIYDRYAL